MDAYKAPAPPLTVARPCACGGAIQFIGGDLTEAVRSHHASEQHADWRRRGGLAEPSFEVDVR